LHLAIQEAFEFDDDHLYSFFMDNKKWSHDRYEYPLMKGHTLMKSQLGNWDYTLAKPFFTSSIMVMNGSLRLKWRK